MSDPISSVIYNPIMNHKYTTESLKIQFENQAGFMLDARLDCPVDTEPTSFAIISHCFTCTKETLTTARVSRGLAQKGMAVLRFDFTGLGNSEGQFEDTNFTSMVSDILSASQYLNLHHTSPTTLIGHSMGGTAALAAASKINSCQSVITIASPSQPEHILHHFGKAMKRLEAGENAHIVVAGNDYPVKPQFISDVRNYDIARTIKPFNKRLLCIRAGKDELVATKDADEIIQYTTSENELLHMEQADHLFRDRAISDSMIQEMHQWIDD